MRRQHTLILTIDLNAILMITYGDKKFQYLYLKNINFIYRIIEQIERLI